jgi:Phage-related minor tail protein
MTVFAEVVGLLRLQTDASSFANATKSIGALGRSVQAAIGADVVGRLVSGVRDFANAADDLGDQSEQLGISARDLQAYSAAAGEVGINQEKLTASFARLTESAAGAAQNLDGPRKLFRELGVNVTNADGTVKNLGQLLPDVSNGLQRIENPTKRAAVTMQLFGAHSARLRLILEKGSQGLEDMRKGLDELGGGISDEAIKKAGEFEAATTRMTIRARAFGGDLITAVIPGLVKFEKALGSTFGPLRESIDGTSVLGAGLATTAGLAVAAGAAMALAEGRAAKLGKAGFLIAGLTFAFDELRAAVSGADSAMGKIVDKLGGEGTIDAFFKNYAAGFQAIKKGAKTGNFGVTEEELLPGIARARREERARKTQAEAEALISRELKQGTISRDEAAARRKAVAEDVKRELDSFQPLQEQTAPRALARGLAAGVDQVTAGRVRQSTVQELTQTPFAVFQDGAVRVNVQGTNASHEEIKKAASEGTEAALDKHVSAMRSNVRRKAPVAP